MSFAFTVLIFLTVRHHNVKAQPQDENAFVPKPTQLRAYNDLSEEDSYVDSTHQEYYQTTSATPPATKVDRDDGFLAGLAQGIGKAAAFTHSSATGFTNNLAGKSATQFSLSGIGNLDSAASSFNGFGQPGGGGGYSFPSGGSGFGGHGGGTQPSFGHGGGGGGNFFNSGGSGGGVYGNTGGSGGDGHGSGEGGYNHLPPVIHKSVYVHVAPPDEDVPKQKVIIPKVPPKKNYQIVFIKAPTPPTPSAPVIPPFPPQSDKTLIYVLHPKPEEAPPIHIPAPPQNLPVKPEVYFIRYKTKKEDDGGYHRRYGRDGVEEGEDESIDATDPSSRSILQESDLPTNQYDEQSDSSVESSNIVHIYTTERGKNAH